MKSIRLTWSSPAWVLCIACVTSLAAGPSFGQSRAAEDGIARNTVYVEFGGAGGIGSVNYDRRLRSGRFAMRLGVSAFGFGATTTHVVVPATASRLIGYGADEYYAEVGAGPTLLIGVTGDAESQVVGTGMLGVRHQPDDGGLFVRLALIPVLSPYDGADLLLGGAHVGLWFGFALGHSF
jgi:hypothetical protein